MSAVGPRDYLTPTQFETLKRLGPYRAALVIGPSPHRGQLAVIYEQWWERAATVEGLIEYEGDEGYGDMSI